MTDAEAMGLALVEAARALGGTAPNPPVGAVVVRDGVVLGVGHTRPPGGPHAEVVALRDCAARGHDPRGATLVVTLEPCRHHGRTPPCTDAILAAGIARVVAGATDPFPEMRGRSFALLRDAGVAVTEGVERAACERRILGFSRSLSIGLPEITVKAATSLDGHLATAAGESKWITGEAARADGHRLRAEHDAVLVGVGTVLADDPRLTVRAAGPTDRQPVPVVLDSALRTPPSASVLRGPRRALVIGVEGAAAPLDADVVTVPAGADGRPDPAAVARLLASRGLHRVLVEGGGAVIRAFFDAGLVDTLELYVAPIALPGGRSWLGGPRVAALADALRFERVGSRLLGPDQHLTLRVLPPPSATIV